jgi:hypothetical protein
MILPINMGFPYSPSILALSLLYLELRLYCKYTAVLMQLSSGCTVRADYPLW